jgi:Raf kinase inhibitor-like YbhB/YbcL family protein
MKKEIEQFSSGVTISSSSIINNKFKRNQLCYHINGSNNTPNLQIEHDPNDKIKSYALLLEDIDAPHDRDGNWVHWLVPYISIIKDELGNINPIIEFPEINTEGKTKMNIGVEQREIVQGLTSWDSVIGYRGPCPPSGSIHRYKLHFYCLNKSLKSHAINEEMTKKKFIREIIDSDMIIYSGEIMGTYEQP